MNKRPHSQVWQIAKNNPFKIGASILLSIIESASLLPIAFLVNQVFDIYIPNNNITNLYKSLGIITSLLVLNAGMQLLNKQLTLKIIKKSIANLRKSLVRSILSYTRLHLSQKDRDLLQSQVVQDSMRVDTMLNSILTKLIPGVLITLGMAVILGTINIFLFILFLSLSPVIGWLSIVLSKKYRKGVRSYHHSFSEFSKGISFILRFNELIHTSSAEIQETEHQDELIDDLQESKTRAIWLSTLLGVIQRQTLMISGVLVLLVGGLFVISGANTLGELISFYVAIGLVNSYARSALGTIPSMLEGRESMKRILSILKSNGSTKVFLGYNSTQKQNNVYEGVAIDKIDTVEFRKVSFGYGERLVLKDVSFNCSIGDFYRIQGPSGIGKSTLFYLLLGFYKPQKGEIFINSIPLINLNIFSVRQLIGFVGQEPMLFSGTIMENLTYGLTNFSQKEGVANLGIDKNFIEQVCKDALIHDFIMDLPNQYDSSIGEQGMLISGGQRQRIAIARALLRKPQILILDEPENNLPQGMVDQILDNIDFEHMIIMLITHKSIISEGQKRSNLTLLDLNKDE
ncbi:MAG: ABC transporter ATP-binding protein [Sphaerochaetaceae bacterium]|nr:ABC transporter ATP-binding protein [Sphaerochaetaceae bacterium]